MTNELSLMSSLTSSTAATSASPAPKLFDNPRMVMPAMMRPCYAFTGAASPRETKRPPPSQLASQIATPMIIMLIIASAATGSI